MSRRTMSRRTRILVAMLVFLAGAPCTWAHHGTALFDTTHIVTLVRNCHGLRVDQSPSSHLCGSKRRPRQGRKMALGVWKSPDVDPVWLDQNYSQGRRPGKDFRLSCLRMGLPIYTSSGSNCRAARFFPGFLRAVVSKAQLCLGCGVVFDPAMVGRSCLGPLVAFASRATFHQENTQ